MAIQQELTYTETDTHAYFGPPMQEAYIKVLIITESEFIVAVYQSRDSRELGSPPVYTRTYPNPYKETSRWYAYNYLKTLPEFAGAYDV